MWYLEWLWSVGIYIFKIRNEQMYNKCKKKNCWLYTCLFIWLFLCILFFFCSVILFVRGFNTCMASLAELQSSLKSYNEAHTLIFFFFLSYVFIINMINLTLTFIYLFLQLYCIYKLTHSYFINKKKGKQTINIYNSYLY